MAYKEANPMVLIQQQIKNNSVDVQTMVQELADWSSEITEKEKVIKGAQSSAGQARKNAKAEIVKPLPPIRNRIDIKSSLA